MAYFRESHYTEKLLVGFTVDQRAALDRVSAQNKRSLAGIVRDAVDLHLVAVADGQGQKGRKNAI